MAVMVGRPRTPDAQIIEGARRALIMNPRASMSEIARSAGVGMSAIYLRFPDRNAVVRRFADDANSAYDELLGTVEQGLENGGDPRSLLERFVTEITESGVHRLGLAIAGTFARSPEDIAESTRLRDRGRQFIRILHGEHVIRPGVTWEDLGKIIEALSIIDAANDERTTALRARMVNVVVTGLTTGTDPLPGSAADALDFRENRAPEPEG